MLAFSEYRRSSPSLSEIRPGMGASRSAVRRLEDRCEEVGIKMTDLRRILLHGILEAGPRATAVEIWKTLGKMMEDGHAPSQGSIQRNLNLFVERGILRRDVTPDRQWLYSVAPERKAALAITFVEAGTGRKIACNAPEVATVLRRVAAEHGLAVQAAAITVTPSAGHDLEAR
ncbi:Fur family transcriptional regulator [Komagataeibacter intermedius]|uniref:Fur family transcriptional regulator n=2 Tax=Komagataeibacter intermedius TaxID=66229 RepID=A0A0N1F6U8_9PROT|nr:Fur family transcriptional regulator [Komagataeibacter intermedius]KPH85245.1 Fur family transcriptional regulator [Komagataeibacter intermedius AF2]MCF3638008.1 Fur family transcriptional regulator [Komagataeibacter intermedius]GAN88362.1 transcriptional regulator ferric uptake Fur [Komagataeibacter intermedius TF2]GBQ72838.1 Fur family transcriptional regulator [Komagataeibacter intermedius NRIC 0521]